MDRKEQERMWMRITSNSKTTRGVRFRIRLRQHREGMQRSASVRIQRKVWLNIRQRTRTGKREGGREVPSKVFIRYRPCWYTEEKKR